MNQAYFRFYAELNDFLPPDRRQRTFVHCFFTTASVKDMIESLGIPHPEVDLILANGQSVDFSYLVRPDDRVSVYPVFESIDITPLVRTGENLVAVEVHQAAGSSVDPDFESHIQTARLKNSYRKVMFIFLINRTPGSWRW